MGLEIQTTQISGIDHDAALRGRIVKLMAEMLAKLTVRPLRSEAVGAACASSSEDVGPMSARSSSPR
jgi:hypothetical protein